MNHRLVHRREVSSAGRDEGARQLLITRWPVFFVLALLLFEALLFGLQLLNHVIHPDLTLWESLIVTNVFAGLLAGLLVWFVYRIRKQGSLQTEATEREGEDPQKADPPSDESVRQRAMEPHGCIGASKAVGTENHVEHRHIAALVQNFPDGMLLVDSESRIMLCNPVARSYLDVLLDPSTPGVIRSLGGRPIEELLRPAPNGLPYHEIEVSSPENRVFEVEARRLSTGIDPEAWGISLRDVTHNRQLQLRAQQQARLAAVGQLAAGIAHDFNNLLMGIIGFSQLLQLRPGVPDYAKVDLEKIVDLGQRAANLVRQILDFSRKSISKRNHFDLAVFLKEATKFLQRTIQESVHISLKITPGEYIIDADPSQMQQVLTNLALNCRDAMPAGGELSIRLSRFSLSPEEPKPYPHLQPGKWIVLSVSDTGCGIPAEVLPHVFEPFYTTKEVGKGTGLGMAQAYGIIKQHGGFIYIESQVDQGTTVQIYLPAVEQKAEVRPKSFGSLLPKGHGESIMFVEDEPDLLAMGKQILQSIGYRVIAASNGHEALKLYEQHMHDIALIVCDYVMPEMGGLELMQEVQKKNPSARFIMLSGYSLEDHTEILQAQGLVACMQKPVSISQMAEAIDRALRQKD